MTPSGHLPSVLSRPDGSLTAGMSAFDIARHTRSLKLWCLAHLPLPPLHDSPCIPLALTVTPHGHWWGSQMLAPSRRPTACQRHFPCDHVTNTLKQLHWLPVHFHINYKLCLCTRSTTLGHLPILTNIVTQTATVSSRSRLQSGSSARYEQLQMQLKLGQRAFSYAAPAGWNSLPPSLQQMTNTDPFKWHLKTLFYQAF